jgi:methyl-accepting chemotaxis protein
MATISGLTLQIGADMTAASRALARLEEKAESAKRGIDRLNKSIVGTTAAATGLATAAAGIGAATAAAAAGAAGGFATIGVIASATKTDVQNTFKGLGQEIARTFQGISGPIDEALTHVARVASGTLGALEGQFAQAFQTVAPYVKTAADTLSRFAQTVMPAAVRITKAAAPVVSAVARGFDALSQGLAGFLDGLGQGMSGAATTIEALFGALGRLLPVLGDVMGSISQAAETLGPAFADAFTELTTVVLRFLEAAIVPLAPHIATVVEGFASFMRAIRQSVGPVAAFTSVALPLAGLFAGMTSAISPVTLAATALGAAAVTLHNNWSEVTSYLKENFPQAFAAARSALSATLEAAREIFGKLAGVARPVMEELAETVQTWLGWISSAWSAWGEQITGAVSDYFGQVVRQIKTYISIAGSAIEVLLNVLTGDWAQAWEDAKSAAWGALRLIVNTAVTAVRRVLQAMQSLAQYVPGVGDQMAGGLGTAIERLKDLRIEAEKTQEAVSGMSFSLPGFSGAMGGGGGSAVAASADVAASKVEQLRNSIRQTVSEADALAKRVPESLSAVERSARSAEEAIQSMTETFDNVEVPEPLKEWADILDTTTEKLRGLSQEVREKLKEIADKSIPAAKQALESFYEIMSTIEGLPRKLLRQTATGIGKTLGGMMARAFGAMTKQQERLKRRIRSTQKQLTEALSEGASQQVARLRDKLSQLRDSFQRSKFTLADIGQQLIQTIAGALQKIGGLLITAGTAFASMGGPGGLIMSVIANPLAAVAAGAALTALSKGLSMAVSSAPAPVGSGGRGRGGAGGGRVSYNTPSAAGSSAASAMGGLKTEMSQMRAEQRKTNERLARNQAETNERLASVESATRSSKNVSESEVRRQKYRAERAQRRTNPRT